MVLYAQEQFSFFYMRAILNKAHLNAIPNIHCGNPGVLFAQKTTLSDNKIKILKINSRKIWGKKRRKKHSNPISSN